MGRLLDRSLHRGDGLLDPLAVVDVDVSEVVLDRPAALGKVLGMVMRQVPVGLAVVPLLDLACYIGIDVAMLVDVVGPLINQRAFCPGYFRLLFFLWFPGVFLRRVTVFLFRCRGIWIQCMHFRPV